MAKDPICGMEVDKNSAIKVAKGGKEYFFCSTYCRDKFIKQEGTKETAVCYPSAKRPFFKHKLFIVSSMPKRFPSLFPFLSPFARHS